MLRLPEEVLFVLDKPYVVQITFYNDFSFGKRDEISNKNTMRS